MSATSRDTTWIAHEFDRRAATYDESEMHRLQADQAARLLRPLPLSEFWTSPPEPAWRPALAHGSLTRLNGL
jgi:hypothetical protein